MRYVAWLLTLCAAIGLGCTKNDNNLAKNQSSHVRILANLHALATTKLGHVPRNAPEFKQTIAQLGLDLEKRKIGSIDELFISERDGQPLIVSYGPGNANSDVVVYEQNGINGKRMVGHRIGMVEELDEAQCKKLIAPPK